MRLPIDGRYTIQLEGTGKPNAQYVVRFCGDWLASFSTEKEAVAYAVGQVDERRLWTTYHRRPTESDFRFGHGATHYREFKFSECYNPKTGELKRRFKAKDDGLWYSRG